MAGFEECFSTLTGMVYGRKKGEVAWQFFLGESAMGSSPRTEQ